MSLSPQLGDHIYNTPIPRDLQGRYIVGYIASIRMLHLLTTMKTTYNRQQLLHFFCNDPCQEWPFTKQVCEPTLVSTTFDSEIFTDSDFKRSNIHKDATILGSVKKRKAEFLAGRICAREALSIHGNTECNILANRDRSPEWPQAVVGSITHTDNAAAAVVASKEQYQGVGVDFQELTYDTSISEIVLTPLEQQRLFAMDSAEKYVYLTIIFSLKECLFKALYPIIKIYFDFQYAEITKVGSNTASIVLRKNLSEEWQKGTVLCGYYVLSDNIIKSIILIQNRKYSNLK